MYWKNFIKERCEGKKALEYYNRFIQEELNQSENYFERAIAYYTRCRWYLNQTKYKTAIEDANEAVKNIEIEIRGDWNREVGERKKISRIKEAKKQHFLCYASLYNIYLKQKMYKSAEKRLNHAYKLANDYKCYEDLFRFLVDTGHHFSFELKMFPKAERLYKEAYDRRHNILDKTEDGEDNRHKKKELLYELYLNWGKNYIGTHNLSRALGYIKEAHYLMPRVGECSWLCKALILYEKLKEMKLLVYCI